MDEIKELLEMHSKTTSKFHDKLKRFCDPLTRILDVSQFHHTKLSHTGQYVTLGLHAEWDEFALSTDITVKNWPTFHKSEFLNNNIIIMKPLFNDKLMTILQMAREKYKVNHCLELINRTNEGIEIFGFGIKTSDPIQHMRFLNELPILQSFIKCYREEFKAEIPTFKNFGVDISQFIGSAFHAPPPPTENERRNRFLKEMRIEVPHPLTDREMDVTHYFIQGCSASEIGEKLFISKRTVEHHLERIKNKFDCSKKSELIQKLSELQTIGYT